MDKVPRLIASFRTFFNYPIPIRALMLFFESLAVQLNAGRVIDDSILNASYCCGDVELTHICRIICPKIRNGSSICACLRPYEHRFPELVICLLKVGEESGSLADSAERLGRTYKRTLDFQRDLSVNIYNPWLVLTILCVLQAILSIARALTVTGPDQPLISIAVTVVESSALLAFELIAGYLCLRVLLSVVYRWYPLRLIVDTIKLALPRLGLIARNLSAARWARSFAVLWSAGVNISYALEVSADSSLNAHFERELFIAAKKTREGTPLSESLKQTQLLPRDLLAVLRTSELSGKLDDQLLRFAVNMEASAFDRAMVEMNRFVVTVQLLAMVLVVIYILSQMGSAA